VINEGHRESTLFAGAYCVAGRLKSNHTRRRGGVITYAPPNVCDLDINGNDGTPAL